MNSLLDALTKSTLLTSCKCFECPNSIDGKPNKPVWGVGPEDPLAVLVGESPGEDEAEIGKPFVGRTGRALDIELQEVGLNRSKLLVVNAALCKPIEKDSKRMAKAVKCCKPAFEGQIAKFRTTKHFFLMGRFAAYAFYGRFLSLDKSRGFIRGE